jgi:hypothetical protein
LELSSFGNPGGFIDLDAQVAWQYEIGARGRRVGVAWELSLYDIELRNEILNINVRPFPNAPSTHARRRVSYGRFAKPTATASASDGSGRRAAMTRRR